MIDIRLQPEYVASIGSVPVTNTFLTSMLVTLTLALFALLFAWRGRRGGFVGEGLRVFVFELLRLTDAVTGDRALSKRFLPLIATFFLFIVTANLLALLPGFLGSFFVESDAGRAALVRSPNSDLTTTLALALFSVVSIQLFSLRALGPGRYLGRFIDTSGPIAFIMGFFEMISEAVKVLSFSFRLFGNVFAGEILLVIIAFLVPYFVPLPFMILEVFVGVIQAFIFAALTLTFLKTGTVRRARSAQEGV